MRLKNRPRRNPLPRVVAATAAAGIALAAALVRRRRAAAGQVTSPFSATSDAGPREWHCDCGQEFRVSGVDRHRVFWLPESGPQDPVLGDVCPNCERHLLAQDQ